jgi:hypothetical protein
VCTDSTWCRTLVALDVSAPGPHPQWCKWTKKGKDGHECSQRNLVVEMERDGEVAKSSMESPWSDEQEGKQEGLDAREAELNSLRSASFLTTGSVMCAERARWDEDARRVGCDGNESDPTNSNSDANREYPADQARWTDSTRLTSSCPPLVPEYVPAIHAGDQMRPTQSRPCAG